MRPYLKDPETIYAESFAIVRKEARLDRFDSGMARVVTRIVHACGMPDVADRIVYSPCASEAAQTALTEGAPVLCDCGMVTAGISVARLPRHNDLVVTLNHPLVPTLAKQLRTTRSAAAVDLWHDRIEGAIVVIGNAPTALFHLLEQLDSGWPKPAVILGFPVGFIGAEDSKTELATNSRGCEFIALKGRLGGSAMASAALNALAELSREDQNE